MQEKQTAAVNDWSQWAQRVLHDIERLELKQDAMMLKISDVSVELAVIKTKAASIGAIWGGITAIIADAIPGVWVFFTRR